MQKHKNQEKVVQFFTAMVVAIVTGFLIFQLITSKNMQHTLFQEQILQEAKAHFQSMQDTRLWNARLGGVYAKETPLLQPNKYLKNNVMYSDTNQTYVKINPAWMTRQISTLANKQSNYHFKITSLKPLNPNNAPDVFETEALNYFDTNHTQKYYYRFNDKENKFDFMGSLTVKQACLKCHAQQGYKLGDIRGGIRISVPLDVYVKQKNLVDEKTQMSIWIVLVSSISIFGILLGLIYWFYKRQYEIEHMNIILEEKVNERTIKLKKLVSHEKHLKDILHIITEVNELLISSYSVRSILTDSTYKLSQNNTYSLVLSGLLNDDVLDIVSISNSNQNIFKDSIVLLKEKSDNFVVKAIQSAIFLKHVVIEKNTEMVSSDVLQRRENDIDAYWLIALPLLNDEAEEVFGVTVVLSSREEGFEPEEIRILENMAHDISISLYSHKQRETLLAMEKEKVSNYEETILAFVHIIEQRDTYTAGHTVRVAQYCTLIATQMKVKPEDIHLLEKAAILHDIGKVATPDTVLLKPGRLTVLEYELIKQHSEIGASMLEHIEMYKDLAHIIRYHHSRYDGKGYPRTQNHDEIPFMSHILIVADAFDAMTSNRIYKPRKSVQAALEEIQHQSGQQFHPEVVQAAMQVLKSIDLVDTTQLPISDLEERRMAYFFQDKLTGVYNEDYLQIVLNSNNKMYKSLNIIYIHGFSNYNNKYGWEAGNNFLKQTALTIEKHYPNCVIIRYHGDDFIILSKEQMQLELKSLNELLLKETKDVSLNTKYYTLNATFTYTSFVTAQSK